MKNVKKNMKELKRKTDPEAAYNYCSKNNIKLLKEEEKVFLNNPAWGIKYALDVKKDNLCPEVEKYVCNYFYNLSKKEKVEKSLIQNFIKYFSKYKIPNEKKILNSIPVSMLHFYAVYGGKRLPLEFEKKMFNFAKKKRELWNVVEYSYALKTKLPDYIHNYMIAQSLCETIKSEQSAIQTYFINISKFKELLIKISSGFDKSMTIQEVIDSL